MFKSLKLAPVVAQNTALYWIRIGVSAIVSGVSTARLLDVNLIYHHDSINDPHLLTVDPFLDLCWKQILNPRIELAKSYEGTWSRLSKSDELFAGEVPAALRLDLVFDVEGGDAGAVVGEGPGDHVGACVL